MAKTRGYNRLLESLRSDLEPVGTVEEPLVEEIVQEYWRLGVAAWHEAEALARENAFRGRRFLPFVSYQTTINRHSSKP